MECGPGGLEGQVWWDPFQERAFNHISEKMGQSRAKGRAGLVRPPPPLSPQSLQLPSSPTSTSLPPLPTNPLPNLHRCPFFPPHDNQPERTSTNCTKINRYFENRSYDWWYTGMTKVQLMVRLMTDIFVFFSEVALLFSCRSPDYGHKKRSSFDALQEQILAFVICCREKIIQNIINKIGWGPNAHGVF